MPTNTFYRLPVSKKNRLIQAAWLEFSQYSFADSSINRIIQSAGIPRGSFYQYFSDKGDLFPYITQGFETQFSALLRNALNQCENDLGSSLVFVFDHWFLQQNVPTYTQNQCICLLKNNPDMDWQNFIPASRQSKRFINCHLSVHLNQCYSLDTVHVLFSLFVLFCKQAFFCQENILELRTAMQRLIHRFLSLDVDAS